MNIVLLEPLGIPEELLASLAKPLVDAGHSFKAYEKNTDPAVQMKRLRDADAVILANMPLSGEVIRGCPNLKFIDIAFTGVDHVDLNAAREKGVKISNAAGYSTQAVAELTLCMMLSLLRNVPAVERRCREGLTKDGLVGRELKGKTVGIVGLGAIGSQVALLCFAFGCKVLGFRRRPDGSEPSCAELVSLDELLSRSDIVTLHCPINDSSRGLINREAIGRMKQSALLINAARGPVVDSEALAQALNEGRLAGAAIDVFEAEPPLNQDHPLLKSKNTIVTPHVAFASEESMEARARIVFDNLAEWMNGRQRNKIL